MIEIVKGLLQEMSLCNMIIYLRTNSKLYSEQDREDKRAATKQYR